MAPHAAKVSRFWSSAVVCYTLSSLASCATDVLTGQTHHETVRWLLLRLVAVIFAVNFLSVAVQCRGLIGPSGILPLQETLSELEENMAYRDRKGLGTPVSSRLMVRWTLFVWRTAGEANVRAAAWCGFALALGMAAAPLHPWLTAAGYSLLYLGWYVYKRGLGAFANLQWDMLLLEVGMLCALLAAAPPGAGATVAVHLLRAVVVRLHMCAGFAKLTSGDPHWAGLTALAVHHETQPLPTPLAPLLHALPLPMHKLMTLAGLGLEIGAGIACAPAALLSYAGELSFAMVVLTQASIAASGNYGYFNLLSALLGLSLLSDQSPLLRPLAPAASAAASAAAPAATSSAFAAAHAVHLGLVLLVAMPIAAAFATRVAAYTEGRCRRSAPLRHRPLRRTPPPLLELTARTMAAGSLRASSRGCAPPSTPSTWPAASRSSPT